MIASRNIKTTSLFRATSVILLATVLSAVFGVLREVIVAGEFGTTKQTDAYFFAFSLSLGVAEFLWGGMAAALISVYAFVGKQGRDVRESFACSVINAYFVFLVATSVLFAIATPFITRLLAAGFDGEGQRLVVTLIWCLIPSIVFFGLWMTIRTLLEAEQSFFVAQLSTAFLSVGVVAAVLLLAPHVGVYSLPVGITVGTAIQFVWVVYWLKRIGFRYRFELAVRTDEFRRFLTVLAPGILAGLISGAIPIIDRSMASHLPEGSIASLSFAGRPMNLVCRFGLYSLITALLPTLALKAAHENSSSFRDTVAHLLSTMIFVTTPLALILAALRVPIIQILFERGNFSAEATAVTSSIFAVLALGLMPMSVAVALTTVFKSLQDTKTVAFVGGGCNLLSKVGFNLLFILPFGVLGLAMSSALEHAAGGFVLLMRLRSRLEGINARHLAHTLAKSVIASLVTFLAVDFVVTHSVTPPLIQCLIGGVSGAATYLTLALVLRVQELTLIVQQISLTLGFASIPSQLANWLPALPSVLNDDNDAKY